MGGLLKAERQAKFIEKVEKIRATYIEKTGKVPVQAWLNESTLKEYMFDHPVPFTLFGIKFQTSVLPGQYVVYMTSEKPWDWREQFLKGEPTENKVEGLGQYATACYTDSHEDFHPKDIFKNNIVQGAYTPGGFNGFDYGASPLSGIFATKNLNNKPEDPDLATRWLAMLKRVLNEKP